MDGCSITAPPTIPGCLLLHAQLQRSYTTFLQNELLSIKAHRCSHSILSSVFSYLVQEKTSHSGLFFIDQNSLRFTSVALADSMDDDGPVVDRGPRGSGSLVVSLDALQYRNRDIPVEVQQQQTDAK